MKHFYSLILLTLAFLFQSCDDEDLEATVPAYIKIDEIPVQINKPEEGSSSSKISDAWVFVNDQLIGAFELPTTVPILQTGPVNIKIRGGVFNNGLSNQRIVYPFYEFFEINPNLVPEVVYEPDVVVEYKVGSVFNPDWPGQNFDELSSRPGNIISNPNGDTILINTTDPSKVFEGRGSGILSLPVGTTFAEFYTEEIVDVPRIGSAVYLEMDYKTTHDFAVSIYTNNREQQFSVINFRANNQWNKVYIDFSRVFSTLFNATNYNIAIGMIKPQGENAELLIDNLKLINF